MKKYLMATVALICMTMTCVMFAACSSDNDETANIIYYRANGRISASGSDIAETFSSVAAVADYTTAIESVAKDYSTVSKDNEVIAACDKVFASHRTNHPSWKGTVTITKYQGLDNQTGKVIKTYTYE